MAKGYVIRAYIKKYTKHAWYVFSKTGRAVEAHDALVFKTTKEAEDFKDTITSRYESFLVEPVE